MGAGASTKLADAPDPVPKDVAERTLGVTLDAAEWAARADADGRVSQARLLAESDKVARADEFFRDLGEFFRFRKDIDALWASQDGREALEAVEAVDKVKVDHRYEAVGQQVAPRTRAPVDSVAELYEAAEMARPAFEVVLRRCAGAGVLKVAPLKGQVRALEKARFDYAERPSPLSWLSDVVRGTIVCENASDAVAAYEALRATPGVQIVKLSNRYARPTPAGFRDLNVKFRLDPRAAAGNALGGSLSDDAVDHVCECQVRIAGLDGFAASRDSHRFYEFFRHYFRGDWTQVEQQAATITSSGDFDVPHAVARIGRDENRSVDALHLRRRQKTLLYPPHLHERLALLDGKAGGLEAAIVKAPVADKEAIFAIRVAPSKAKLVQEHQPRLGDVHDFLRVLQLHAEGPRSIGRPVFLPRRRREGHVLLRNRELSSGVGLRVVLPAHLI